jgi:hypothetical protein
MIIMNVIFIHIVVVIGVIVTVIIVIAIVIIINIVIVILIIIRPARPRRRAPAPPCSPPNSYLIILLLNDENPPLGQGSGHGHMGRARARVRARVHGMALDTGYTTTLRRSASRAPPRTTTAELARAPVCARVERMATPSLRSTICYVMLWCPFYRPSTV